MKISRLFHWLYAILMFLPFGLLVYNSLASMWSGNIITNNEDWFYLINNITFITGSLTNTVYNVYYYLVVTLFGFADVWSSIVPLLLTYWTCVSIIWLVFDVFMYVPLLVHRWIDKAKLE